MDDYIPEDTSEHPPTEEDIPEEAYNYTERPRTEENGPQAFGENGSVPTASANRTLKPRPRLYWKYI